MIPWRRAHPVKSIFWYGRFALWDHFGNYNGTGVTITTRTATAIARHRHERAPATATATARVSDRGLGVSSRARPSTLNSNIQNGNVMNCANERYSQSGTVEE
jgi:hypothetical protein